MSRWRPFSWVLEHAQAFLLVPIAVSVGIMIIWRELPMALFFGVPLVPVALVLVAGFMEGSRRRAARRARTVESEWVPMRSAQAFSGRWKAIGSWSEAGTAGAFRRESRRGVALAFHGGQALIHGVVVNRPAPGPTVSLVPDSGWERRVGAGEVDVESVAFNERWRPSGEDLRYTHAVLNPRVMERLLQADTEGLSVLLEGAHIVVYRHAALDLGQSDRMAQVAFDLRDLLRSVRDPKVLSWRWRAIRPGKVWYPEP